MQMSKKYFSILDYLPVIQMLGLEEKLVAV